MSEICCQVCLESYSEHIKPRMLPTCGHSICSKCLTSVLQNSMECPICRINLPHRNQSNYLVNYSLLQVCRSPTVNDFRLAALEDLKRQMTPLPYRAGDEDADLLKEEMNKILEKHKKIAGIRHVKKRIKDLLVKQDEIIAKAEILIANGRKNKQKLVELDQKEIKYEDFMAVNQTLEGVEHNLSEMSIIHLYQEAAALEPASKQATGSQNKSSTESTSKQTRNTRSSQVKPSIRQIYEDVRRGRKVEAVGSVEGERKIWRMSYEGDKLLLHCAESASKDPSAVSLQFDEVLKQMEEGGNFSPFFDLESEDKSKKCRIFPQLSEDEGVEQLRELFVRLVTGQEGKEGGYRGGEWGCCSDGGFNVSPPENIREKLFQKYESVVERTEHATDVADPRWKMYFGYYGSFDILSSRCLFGRPWRLIGKLSPEDQDKVQQIVNNFDLGKCVDCGVSVNAI